MGRTVAKWAVSITLAILILTGMARTVLADPADPDRLQVRSLIVTRHNVEADDFLVAFDYNIEYASLPDDPADDTYIFRLMSVNATSQMGSVVPYPYFNDGYNHGLSGFYFSAADAPTWGEEYVLRICGNPAFFADPPELNFTLTTDDYSTAANQTASQAVLADYVVDVIEGLEIQYDTTLTAQMESDTILNGVGEAYVRGALPGVQVLAPSLAFIQSVPVVYDTRTWQTTQATTYEQRYDGTSFSRALNSIGGFMGGIDGSMVFASFFLVGGVGAIGASAIMFRTATHGLIAAALILLVGTLLGAVPMALTAIIALVAALLVGYLLFFRSS